MSSRIVIIGGGPSSRYLLNALGVAFGEHPETRVDEIVVLERNGSFGLGLPYDPDVVLPEHSLALNQRTPRVRMGEELVSLMRSHVERLRQQGVVVRLVPRAEVVDVEPRGSSGYRITAAGDLSFDADFAFLATGHWTSRSSYEGTPGCVTSVWPAAALQKAVAERSRIAILGSALTAVDAVKSIALGRGRFIRRAGKLRYVQRRGTPPLVLTLYSRNGWLPRVAGYGISWARQEKGAAERLNRFLNAPNVEAVRRRRKGHLRLQDLYRLLFRDLAHSGAYAEVAAEVPGLSGRHLRRDLLAMRAQWSATGGTDLFRSDFERARQSFAERRHVPWQSVIWEKILLLNTYFSFVDGEERRLYLEYETLLMRWLQLLHFANAEQVMALFEAGCLRLAALGPQPELAPVPDDEGWIVRFADRGGSPVERRHEILVDGRGQRRDIEDSLSPLHARLLRRGLIQPALVPALGRERRGEVGGERFLELDGRLYFRPGGIHVNPDTWEAIPRGETRMQWRGSSGGLFVMGPLALGQFLAFVGLRALPGQAQCAVTQLVERQWRATEIAAENDRFAVEPEMISG